VVLGDPDLDEPAGIRRFEPLAEVRVPQIAVEDDDPLVGGDLHDRVAERFARGRRAAHGLRPMISAMARSPCSAFGAFPCHSGLSSIHDTPLPLMVWDRIAVGFSVVACASCSAASTWAWSAPTLSRGCQVQP